MFPWVRSQIAKAWSNRKSARTAKRQPMALSSVEIDNLESNDIHVPTTVASENFIVNVISLEGDVFGITVKPDNTVGTIKSIAVKHFYDTATKLPSQFRLIHSSKLKQLIDGNSISDEGVKEKDELILVEVRSVFTKENLTEAALKGPTEDEIRRATEGLPLRNPPKVIPSTDCVSDFQNEIRKVLITLVQASSRILQHSPQAQQVYEIIKEKVEARCKPTIDSKAVKILLEMGYAYKDVIKALSLQKSNVAEALEWLIEHQDNLDDDADADLNLSTPEGDADQLSAGPSSPLNARKKSLKEACIELFKGNQARDLNLRNLADICLEVYITEILGTQDSKKEDNLINAVELLLESFRRYRKLDFKPNSKTVQSLLEMGFEEKDIIDALKMTGNDQANACEWLLGERGRNLQDLDEGLDPEGPIYKAIMSNPHIQLSLMNSRMLLAYLSMLESPASTNVWMNDPEVSPVLSQIFKTYHAEKHAIHTNRYAVN